MSEEKLYAVKNAEGKYWDFGETNGFLSFSNVDVPVTLDKDLATEVARNSGGHVVTFVEEPEKVVVSPEEAKLVKNCLWTNLQDAFLNNINLLFRGRRPEDVTRLKSALTNGYTVAKEKKYNVKVPHTRFYYWKWKADEPGIDALTSDNKKDERYRFTEAEIEHYGLQDCEKVWCDSDD